jgi:hypothetical protein
MHLTAPAEVLEDPEKTEKTFALSHILSYFLPTKNQKNRPVRDSII